MSSSAALAAVLSCSATAVFAQTPSIAHVDTVSLPTSTVDQNGAPFTISELSGICRVDGDDYLAVMDGGGKLVALEIVVADDGTVTSVVVTGGISLAEVRDYEGVVCGPAGAASAFVSEEGTPAVREVALADGAPLQAFPTPAVFANVRPNLGFESLARGCDGATFWTANEEALSVDGPRATPSNGTTVRLLRYDLTSGAPLATEQLAYEVEPMHGGVIPGGSSSGLSELLVLPDGRLLALERSLALASPLFLTRMYLLDGAGATDVSSIPALDGASYAPVAKTLVYSGSHSNLEGLCVGRELPDGALSLLGVVDDGDPISAHQLVVFMASGFGPDPCTCDAVAFCSAAPNSAGAGAHMGWSGSTSVSANDLVLSASAAIPGQAGLFYYGPLETQLPFGDGFRCVDGGALGTFRLNPPVIVDGAGVAQRAVDLTAPPADAGPGAITAGSSWSFQFWYRDPNGPGGSGFNLSDGLTVNFCR